MEDSEFWTALFKQHQLIPQLAAQLDSEIKLSISPLGMVSVMTNKASILGDSFLSDTFVLDAHLENGMNYKAFIKVTTTRFKQQT